jgi:hypothetical protein
MKYKRKVASAPFDQQTPYFQAAPRQKKKKKKNEQIENPKVSPPGTWNPKSG